MEPLTASLILEQVDRILADPRFRRSAILSRLLRFTVEETLAGRGDQLKEYVLGVEVCGRPPAYDPRTDPIVRVQTRELRRRLSDYYETTGRLDPVVIELPKGRYIATFRLASDQSAFPEPAAASRGAQPEAQAKAPQEGLVPLPIRSAWRQWPALAVAAITAVFAIIWIVSGGIRPFIDRGTAAPLPPSIAVLPFVNLGSQPDDDYLSEGMTDEIISAAARVDGLRVLGRTSVFRFRGASEDEREIARQLKVDAIVSGSVRREGTRLRITARLVRTVDGGLVWSETFDGERSELFDVQERIARAVATALAVRLAGDQDRRARGSTLDPEARTAYLKGRFFWNKRTHDGMVKALDFFQQAVARDPEYAEAFAGLAEAHIMSIWYAFATPRDAIARAKAAALTAVRLQPSFAETRAAMGSVNMMEWDWEGATESLEQAMALDPDYPRAAHLYAYTMLLVNRPEKAVAAMKRAQELDPLSLVANADLAEILDFAGHTDEAIEQARKTIEMDPNFAITHYALMRALRRKGRDHEALQEHLKFDELRALPPEQVEALKVAAAADGWRGYYSKRLEQLIAPSPGRSLQFYEIGLLHANLGRPQEAFDWFERAYDHHDARLVNVGIDLADALRHDPRFRDLQRRMGLPEQGLQVSATH